MPRTVSSASARSATPAPSVLETPSALGTPEAEQRVLPELQLEPEAEAEAEQEPEPGVGLGIGLSDTHRWPPGGAELTYALRTTLFDHGSALFAARGSVWAGIEDRVSFALRDLPPQGVGEDALRAQWLDPQGEFLVICPSN
jgi:hypothetical protein